MRMLTRQGRGQRRIQDPAHHLLPTPILPRWWPMPISSCPTRPISSAGTASRCSTGRSAIADGPGDAIRQPVVEPDRDVRPFQDVLLDLGARLKLPGMINGRRQAALSRRLCRLHGQSRAPARHRHAGRLARHERRRAGHGRAEPPPARPLHRRTAASGVHEIPDEAALLSASPTATSRLGGPHGFLGHADSRSSCSSIREPLQKFRLAAEGHGTRQPPDQHRERASSLLRSAAVLVSAVRRAARRQRGLSAARHHPAADGACIIPGARRMPGCARSRRAIALYHRRAAAASARPRRRRLGVDRKPARPREGAVKLMEGVNPDTVWTWNAIGKRARRLEPCRRRAGIDEGLPAQPSDLGTAAAAAGRLSLRQHRSGDRAGGLVRPRVRIEKCAPEERTRPRRPRSVRRCCRPPGRGSPTAPSSARGGAP